MNSRKIISVRRAAIQDVVDWCIDHLIEFDEDQLNQISFLAETELLDREHRGIVNEQGE